MSRLAATRFLVPLTAGAVALGGLALPATAQAGPAAVAASRWQAGQLDPKGGIYNQQYRFTDWGLTVDTLYALQATGSSPRLARKSAAYVARHVRSYNSLDDFNKPGVRLSGATGKLLVAAVATRSNPANFGGFNLRRESLALMVPAGAQKGRFKDKGTRDNSNTFGQSFNVLGLARTGGAPQPAVDLLIRQQCRNGGFRLTIGQAGAPCEADSTALAVQALLAAHRSGAKRAGESARKGALWLKRVQRRDGSFGGAGPTAASNTSSTGLAGQAMRAIGGSRLVLPRTAAELRKGADRAGTWVRALQLTRANAGQARRDVGAIAYTRASLNAARRDGIKVNGRDEWRRANAQALLVLARVSLADLGK